MESLNDRNLKPFTLSIGDHKKISILISPVISNANCRRLDIDQGGNVCDRNYAGKMLRGWTSGIYTRLHLTPRRTQIGKLLAGASPTPEHASTRQRLCMGPREGNRTWWLQAKPCG